MSYFFMIIVAVLALVIFGILFARGMRTLAFIIGALAIAFILGNLFMPGFTSTVIDFFGGLFGGGEANAPAQALN